MGEGLVSVIIPTYKRPDNLKMAINSVINQTYKNIEIIVVDDNNPNTSYRAITENIMKDYMNYDNIKYLKHKKNLNGSAARNTGIKEAKGRFITFLDDDDEMMHDKIERQISKLENLDITWGAVYCGCNFVKESKVVGFLSSKKEGNLKKELLLTKWGIGSGSTPLFRKAVFDDIGLFDESFIRHQDWEILIRMFRKYKIAAISDILLNKYVDDTSNAPNIDKFLMVKQKYLDTFKVDINEFDKKTQNQIYKYQWLDLCFNCSLSRDYKNTFKYLKKASSYENLNFNDIVSLINLLIHGATPKFIKYVYKNIKNKFIYSK